MGLLMVYLIQNIFFDLFIFTVIWYPIRRSSATIKINLKMIFCLYLEKREELMGTWELKLSWHFDSRVFALCIICTVDSFFPDNLYCIEHAEVATICFLPCIGFYCLFIFLIVGIKLNLIYICLSAHTHMHVHMFIHVGNYMHVCVTNARQIFI